MLSLIPLASKAGAGFFGGEPPFRNSGISEGRKSVLLKYLPADFGLLNLDSPFMCLTAIFTSKSAFYNYILNYNKTMVPGFSLRRCSQLHVGCASHHPDWPGLRRGARLAGSGLRGHTCVLSVSGSVRVTCAALPAWPGGEGLVSGDSGPGTAAVLRNPMAQGAAEKDLISGLAAHPHCCAVS